MTEVETTESIEVVVRQDAVELLQAPGRPRARVVIADPPYGVSYQSNHRKEEN